MRFAKRGRLRAFAAVLLLAALTAGCGGNDASSGTASGDTDDNATKLTVLMPINSPIIYPFRVAEEEGYYADENLDVTFQFLDGGGLVVTQLVAGNGDLGLIPVGDVAEALSQGHTDLRAIWNAVYGSIFYLAVPEDSPIRTVTDLKGKNIGVTALSGGEVPIIRGMARGAGLAKEDYDLTPIGQGTALAVRAIKGGQVDAFGGSVNDIVALEAAGLKLRYIVPDVLKTLPASGIAAKESFIKENRTVVEGFLRATTKGAYWAQVDPDATLALLKKVTPEQFQSPAGEAIFKAIIPITWNANGPMGAQSADTWVKYFDFIGAKRPEIALDKNVVQDFIGPANDFDKAEVAQDAKSYRP